MKNPNKDFSVVYLIYFTDRVSSKFFKVDKINKNHLVSSFSVLAITIVSELGEST